MWQVAQKPRRKFCGQKTAKKRKTHPIWAKKGETGCVSGAGEGCSRYGRVGKPEIRTKMHKIAMQHMKKGNRRKPSVFAGFLAGAEGLEPSARGFGVDVETRKRERGRAGVAQFFQPARKRAVLVWCCEKILWVKTGWEARNSIKFPKEIDRKRHGPYNKKRRGNPAGVCCRQAVSHSLEKGGDADGKQPQGESSAICDMLGHRFGGSHSVCPKSQQQAGCPGRNLPAGRLRRPVCPPFRKAPTKMCIFSQFLTCIFFKTVID